MADGSDLDGVGGRDGVLDRLNDTRGGEEKHQNDEYRDDGPGELHLIAAVNLRRLVIFVCWTMAEFDDGVDEEREDNDKDQPGDS